MRRILSVGLVFAVLFAFWIYRFDTLPADYSEYSEVDLASLCLVKGRHEGVDARALYEDVFQRTLHMPPRVSFAAEINPLPLEMLARVVFRELLGTSHLFTTFKLTTLFFLVLGTAYLYHLFGRIFNLRGQTICALLFVSAFPLVSVGRVAGRLGPMLSAFLVASAILHLHFFATNRRRTDFVLFSFFTALCFYNQLHSNIFVIPCVGMYLFFRWVFKYFLSARRGFGNARLSLRKAVICLVCFLLINTLVNASLVIFTRQYLGWMDGSFLRNLFFISQYSLTFIGHHAGVHPHDPQTLWDQAIWYFKSFFIGPYYYYTPNHLEEFNIAHPLFTWVFSFLLLLGVVRFARLMRKRSPKLMLYAIPLGMIFVHVASVLAHYSPLPPRYVLSNLLGYVMLAYFGLQMVEAVARCLRLQRAARNVLSGSILGGHFIAGLMMLYTGDYAKTGGNTLVRSIYVWAGNNLSSDYVLGTTTGTRLHQAPVVCNEEVNRSILGFCTGLGKLDGYYDQFPILGSKREFLQFCLRHYRESRKATFLFYRFAEPMVEERAARITFDYSRSREPDAFSALFENAKPEFVVEYPDGAGRPIRGYSIELSFMSKQVVSGVGGHGPSPPVVTEESFKQAKALSIVKFFKYEPGLIFSFDGWSERGSASSRACDIVIEFFAGDGRRCGKLTYSLIPSSGMKAAISSSLEDGFRIFRTLSSASSNKRRIIAELDKDYETAAREGHHEDLGKKHAEYFTLRLEKHAVNDFQGRFVVSNLSVSSRQEPHGNFLADQKWTETEPDTTLYDLIEIPGMKFRARSLAEIRNSCRLIMKRDVRKKIEGGSPPIPFPEDFLEKKPRFLVIRMKMEKGTRFDLECRMGKKPAHFSIPVQPDGKFRYHVIDLQNQADIFISSSVKGDFKAEVDEMLVYGRD